jgi:hypothetical protein
MRKKTIGIPQRMSGAIVYIENRPVSHFTPLREITIPVDPSGLYVKHQSFKIKPSIGKKVPLALRVQRVGYIGHGHSVKNRIRANIRANNRLMAERIRKPLLIPTLVETNTQ